MVPIELQAALRDEVKKITESMKFKTPRGEQAGLNVFEQNLPMRVLNKQVESEQTMEMDEEDEEDEEGMEHFPYCVVKLDAGKSASAEASHQVNVIIHVGIFDNSIVMDGYKNILNVFEKIRERFRKNPILANRFVAGDEVSWALADEDEETFPFFYGAMYMEWTTAEFRREDELA